MGNHAYYYGVEITIIHLNIQKFAWSTFNVCVLAIYVLYTSKFCWNAATRLCNPCRCCIAEDSQLQSQPPPAQPSAQDFNIKLRGSKMSGNTPFTTTKLTLVRGERTQAWRKATTPLIKAHTKATSIPMVKSRIL